MRTTEDQRTRPGVAVLNYRLVVRNVGLLLIALSLAMLVAAGVEYGVFLGDLSGAGLERDMLAVRAQLVAGLSGLCLGAVMWVAGRGEDAFLGRREALLLVALSWLVGAALAGLPYWLWAQFTVGQHPPHPFESFVSCYFEAMSGLTTTGATVLSQLDPGPTGLPRGLLFWRALTHWLGGLGIVVLFVAVLPTLGVGGKKLFQVEATGPTAQGVRPRIRETARILWLIYLGLTIVQTIVLKLCGMSWFDAVCHTFATLATGGFGTRNASVAAFDSVYVDVTVILFMILAGVNFGLYYQIIRGRIRDVWADPELRLYLAILAIASLVVVGSLIEHRIVSPTGIDGEPSVGAAVRHGVFQVVSIQTTTGFVTADYDHWHFVPKAVLIMLMFFGGCAGSTAGGIKVIRILIAAKVMLAEVERVFRPNVVRSIKVGRAPVDPELRTATLVYLLGIIVLFLIGAFVIAVFEAHGPHADKLGILTALSASAATLNNIGPGLELVGAVQNYGWFSTPSKIVMCILMALGRLEVYAIFVLFMPSFWRAE